MENPESVKDNIQRNKKGLNITLNLSLNFFRNVEEILDRRSPIIITCILSIISVFSFYLYYKNGLGLAYNDARSHLDIGRRVVEGLKPGIAQLGSVWLPLPHILMTFTIWNDFMWHSGLAGAIVSMVSFVVTGLIIYKFLQHLGVGLLGKYFGLFIFIANINILYLQSTAMTELLLLASMTFASYELMMWHKNGNVLTLIKSAFLIMISTLIRYDGWFLLVWACVLVIIQTVMHGDTISKTKEKTKSILKRLQVAEGMFILFATLAGFGIFLWLLWNLVIFKDPLYFAFGPFSAKVQQDQLQSAGVLQTKHNWWLSTKFYLFALMFNSNAFLVLVGLWGLIVMWVDKRLSNQIKLATTALLAPLFFNIVALYIGHSVLFIQGLSGDTWFNVRYGIMLMPSIAIYIGFLIDRLKPFRLSIIGLILFTLFFAFATKDAVTIDDARVGSSQKNVTEVSGWLKQNAANKKGFILISAASHDAIIFSSGLPMKRFIHEGTGLYWENATSLPDRWARWIIMRTYDDKDSTWKLVKDSKGFARYTLVDHFPFADIYEIKPEYLGQLNYEPTLRNRP